MLPISRFVIAICSLSILDVITVRYRREDRSLRKQHYSKTSQPLSLLTLEKRKKKNTETGIRAQI